MIYVFHNVCLSSKECICSFIPYLSKSIMNFRNKGIHRYIINNMKIILL